MLVSPRKPAAGTAVRNQQVGFAIPVHICHRHRNDLIPARAIDSWRDTGGASVRPKLQHKQSIQSHMHPTAHPFANLYNFSKLSYREPKHQSAACCLRGLSVDGIDSASGRLSGHIVWNSTWVRPIDQVEVPMFGYLATFFWWVPYVTSVRS